MEATAVEPSTMDLAREKVGHAERLDQQTGRTYEARPVRLDRVEPLDGRTWAQQHPDPKARWLDGWEKLLVLAEGGHKLPPILVTATGDGKYRMDPSPLGGDLHNSLALLTALRAAGKRQWPAVLVTEPISKDDQDQDQDQEDGYDDEGDDDPWMVPEDQKTKLRDGLLAWAKGIIEAIAFATNGSVPDLAWEGAQWGGGAATPDQVVQAAQDAIQWQLDHLDGFGSDIQGRIEQVLQDSYGDATGFQDALDSMFDWAGARADLYSTAGGNRAWFDGMMQSLGASGTKGGIWVCTFGPGSCADCISLHGQFLTVDELADTKGNTQCDGRCNCGVVPADDPDGFSDDELAAFDENAGEGLT